MLNKLKYTFSFFIIILLSSAIYIGCGNQQDKPEEKEPEKEMTKEGPGENEIWIKNNSFEPAELEVFLDSEVTWINKDTTMHRIISGVRPEILFDSGDLNEGDSFSFEFNDVGPVEFHCEIHPETQGDIIVVNEHVEEITK